jgi:hypothetical protein
MRTNVLDDLPIRHVEGGVQLPLVTIGVEFMAQFIAFGSDILEFMPYLVRSYPRG